MQTPLIIAAKNGHLKCVKVLLAHKCDLYSTVIRNGREMYSWDIASENNHAAVAKYLKGCVGMLLLFIIILALLMTWGFYGPFWIREICLLVRLLCEASHVTWQGGISSCSHTKLVSYLGSTMQYYLHIIVHCDLTKSVYVLLFVLNLTTTYLYLIHSVKVARSSIFFGM